MDNYSTIQQANVISLLYSGPIIQCRKEQGLRIADVPIVIYSNREAEEKAGRCNATLDRMPMAKDHARTEKSGVDLRNDWKGRVGTRE